MSDPSPSTVKAAIVWVLMRLWPRWKRLAEGLDRLVRWIWPGFKEREQSENSNGPEKRWYALETVHCSMTPA